MREVLAISLGKLLFRLTRALKTGGGSAAPGLYALKIDSDLVSKLAAQIPQNIIITGTNGKTTTARILNHLAKNQQKKTLRNATGSNLERGIASALIRQANLLGQIKNIDLGIWELDEAAFNNAAPKIKPHVIVFLNAFRDQLDRYGEVDTIIKKWQQTLNKLPKNTQIFLNGDDTNLLKLKENFTGPVQTFGILNNKIKGEKNLEGKDEVKLDYEASKIANETLDKTTFTVSGKQVHQEITLPVPGIYNVYNCLAALSAGEAAGLPLEQAGKVLKDFSPSFGRVEKINLGEKQSFIFLIKNPVGATQVFQTIKSNLKSGDSIFMALNDNLADGTDVSWIWDANFELIQNSSQAQPKDYKIFCSGTRAYDLALRLKYAGFEPKHLTVEKNIQMALQEATRMKKGRLFILPTYTALLSLQKILAKAGLKEHYWKEST